MHPQYIPLHNRAKNIINQRFGRLVALYSTGQNPNGRTMWFCQCDCENTVIVLANALRSGNTKSCGCLQKERTRSSRRTHGMSESRIYGIWCDAIKRCTNPNYKQYADYGDRGIKVCDRWTHSFQSFYDYVSVLSNFGKNGYTIDRVNNDGNYEPGNIQWSTIKTQSRNTRRNIMLIYNGKTQCVSSWAEELGMAKDALYGRLRRGWPIEKSLTYPVRKRG